MSKKSAILIGMPLLLFSFSFLVSLLAFLFSYFYLRIHVGTVVSGLFVVFVAIVVLRKRIISTMEVWWGWNRNTFTNEDSVEL